MTIEEYIKDKDAFILGFDNVLYPEKDYLLQVYYLFAEFITYTELMDSAQIIAFMQNEFTLNGSENIFEKTAAKFNIPLKYKDNFLLLHQNARLPLKLLLYQQMLGLLQELVVERKEIYLLIDGDPAEQLNKIKQMEWHGLEKYLKVYFSAEFGSSKKSIEFIIKEHNLNIKKSLLVGVSDKDQESAVVTGIEYFTVTKLL
ncbi:haloacid dehalogenase [Pedobacter polaris]|uniref:Haloacid dehalogenase n=1 Tax=Pedobacter polaris TaxID=2571273 RepID=A0A4U1CH30_9SPHI|nr:haloacid dehalogenase [Pedobacter polaris]TKC06605.1 haloacid dehalogenase [Pedobacter polaris]